MCLILGLLNCLGACCARVEYIFHILRFHKVSVVYCDGGAHCVGHHVCHTCGMVIWDRYYDPWREFLADDEHEE